MFDHYVVILDWAGNGDSGVDVLGVEHTVDEAKEIFERYIGEEIKRAIEFGWEVYEDTVGMFDAGEDGHYILEHAKLYIQGVI